MKKGKIVVSSGYFDPLHVGHIRYLRAAKKLGDYHVVLLDDDKAAIKKKGYVFMVQKERKEIIQSLKFVDKVILNWNTAELLKKLRPTIFAKGGDRTIDNIPQEEIDVCKNSRIEMIFKVGGGKVQSGSWLLGKYKNNEAQLK